MALPNGVHRHGINAEEKRKLLFTLYEYMKEQKECGERLSNINNRLLRLMQRRQNVRKNFKRHVTLALNLLSSESNLGPRRTWSYPKAKWFEDVLPYLPDHIFRSKFRMNRETLKLISERLQPNLSKCSTHLREPISVEKRVCIAIFKLSSAAEYRTVAELFGVGISTVCGILHQFVQAVVTNLQRTEVVFYTNEEMFEMSVKFQNLCRMPMSIGAIDGCHIPISSPKAEATDYYNFKGWHSIVLFAVVDADYKFRYVNVGAPGHWDNGHIYQNSSLKRYIDGGQLDHRHINLNGVKVPYMFLADSALPLSKNIMNTFPERLCVDEHQQHFNHCLSKGMAVAENAFERLKARFRMISKRMELKDVKDMSKAIQACVVLHNICESVGDPIESTWAAELRDSPTQPRTTTNEQCSDSGVRIRREICSFINN